MNPSSRKKLVLFGLMSKKPVAGVVWQTVHYLLGFRRLGFDVYYVEAHGDTPVMLMQQGDADGSARAADFIAGVMRRFDLGDRWAFHALHADGRCYGMSQTELKRLYSSAELLINLHGGTLPPPDSAADRLVYLETDPVTVQIELYHNMQQTIDFLEQHCAFFSFAENYGKAGCKLPISERFTFLPTRQPVVLDLWQPYGSGPERTFSTVGSWRQLGREVTFEGETYHWSKHHEFLKFLDLPGRTDQVFELALNRYDETDKRTLENHGWQVRDALSFSTDPDAYRRYITRSRGEFTVAKDQNVRLRTGWFSDRSATYLAAGKPVITQETGFSDLLPTGQGLFAFSEMEEAVQALESIDTDYEHHQRAASALAREYFSYDVVLPPLLADLGLSCSVGKARADRIATSKGVDDQIPTSSEDSLLGPTTPFPSTLAINPTSRHPTTLSEATVQTVLADSAPISPTRFDLLCLPVVEPSPCSQRLRRIMTEFAREGHRVFYFKPNYFSPSSSPEAIYTHESATNLFEVQVPEALIRAASDQTPGDEEPALLQVLETLRRAYGIEAAAMYVQSPRWSSVALHAWERWGWKVVYDRVDPRDFRLIEQWPVKCQRMLQRRGELELTGFETAHQILTSTVAAFKRASIVVTTFNNLVYTKLCLGSVLAQTEYPNYEIIVVDNGSTDGTTEYLRSLMHQHPNVRVVLNSDNLGFARANNQGLAEATGHVLVLLNNDTLVPGGWLTRLVRHLEEPGIGLVGPVTNRISNEAQLDVPYRTFGGFLQFARDYTRAHEGQLFDVRTLMMFCVAMRRNVYERIGPLDERFEMGTFEDDDYAVRARSAGYRVVCAEDAFVHHFGEASFGKLVSTGEYRRLLRANRRRFEDKWDTHWEPHQHRPNQQYRRLIRRIREVARTALPPNTTVAVVSKGDDELLRLDGRHAWHFPQSEDGQYAGYYPSDNAEAITQLEQLEEKGAEFLVFPSTAFWWLEHYEGFKQHLQSRYKRVQDDEHCIIFDLREVQADVGRR